MNRKLSSLLRPAAGAAAVLLLGLPIAAAADDDKAPAGDQNVVKHRVAVITTDGDGDGKKRIWVGDGPMRFKFEEPFGNGYLGVGLIELTSELREHFGVPADAGVMVSRVEADSPAAKAGVKVGDVITGVDGKDVGSSFDLMRTVRAKKDGDGIAIELFRDGKVQKLSATAVEKERRTVELEGLDPADMRVLGDKERMKIDAAMQHSKVAMDEAMRAAGERLRDLDLPALRDRVMVMRSAREAELEKRLAELEKRLSDLQKQIDSKNR